MNYVRTSSDVLTHPPLPLKGRRLVGFFLCTGPHENSHAPYSSDGGWPEDLIGCFWFCVPFCLCPSSQPHSFYSTPPPTGSQLPDLSHCCFLSSHEIYRTLVLPSDESVSPPWQSSLSSANYLLSEG